MWFNPFPTYRCILAHLQQTTFENIVKKGGISPFVTIIQLFSVIIPSIIEFSIFLSRHFQIRLLQICWMWEDSLILNLFPHTTILQQTTLNIFCQKIENLYNWMDNLWLKLENIVAKEEIACFEQFLLLSLCFQKTICYRSVRKRLYEGKG